LLQVKHFNSIVPVLSVNRFTKAQKSTTSKENKYLEITYSSSFKSFSSTLPLSRVAAMPLCPARVRECRSVHTVLSQNCLGWPGLRL